MLQRLRLPLDNMLLDQRSVARILNSDTLSIVRASISERDTGGSSIIGRGKGAEGGKVQPLISSALATTDLFGLGTHNYGCTKKPYNLVGWIIVLGRDNYGFPS
jgi:hypothetical protein